MLKKDKEYLDKEKMILKHYSHPSIFIRRTKKAYISVINEKILELVNYGEKGNSESGCHQDYPISYSALRSYFKRNKMKLNLHYCRKIFATFLRQNGIEQEIIDLLQGRASNSIFLKHYYRPNIDYGKIRSILDRLAIQVLT